MRLFWLGLSLALLLTPIGSLRAQGTLLPPVTDDKRVAPPESTAADTAAIEPNLTQTGKTWELNSTYHRALVAPNMFGSVFGTRWLGHEGLYFSGSTRTVSGFLQGSPVGNAYFFPIPANKLLALTSELKFHGVNLPLSNYTTPFAITGQPYLPINEVAAQTAVIKTSIAKSNESVFFNPSSHAQSDPTISFPIYNVFLAYDFISNRTLLIVPNPADGGLVGRNRVSTDSSPAPRDRVIFNYDFVSDNNLYPSGPTMNRFVLGFEKTFFNGLASVEFRFPFAATVSSTSNADGTFGSGHAEVGNLFVVMKAILHSEESWMMSGGIGLSIPTADDVRLNLGGSDLVKIRNDALILTPFVAALWTPTNRLFAQGWLGVSFDTNGNPAQADLDGKGLHTTGRLYDPTTLQMDAQLGYWLIHPYGRHGLLRGLAPFVEFHYNQQLSGQNTVTRGSFSLTSGFDQLSEFNVSTGAATQIGDNTNLMIGATFPMTNNDNRFNDWQVGVRLNYFFGPTGRTRTNLFN